MKAREILERVLRRKIYRYVGETSEYEYKGWKENPCEDFVIDVSYFVPTYVCVYKNIFFAGGNIRGQNEHREYSSIQQNKS